MHVAAMAAHVPMRVLNLVHCIRALHQNCAQLAATYHGLCDVTFDIKCKLPHCWYNDAALQGPIRDAQRSGQELQGLSEGDLRPVTLRDFQVRHASQPVFSCCCYQAHWLVTTGKASLVRCVVS